MDRNLLEPYLVQEYWTRREAAYLLCNLIPPSDPHGFSSGDMNAGGAVGFMYRSIKDAELYGGLKAIPRGFEKMNFRLVPAKVIAWAVSRGIKVPNQLTTHFALLEGQIDPPASRKRKHYLHSTFEDAKSKCARPDDTGAVWNLLLTMARLKQSQLIGVTEKGIQYSNAKDDIKEFSKAQLDAYLNGTNLTRQRMPKAPRKPA